MTVVSSDSPRRGVRFVSLVPFLLISFGLAWGILALFILLPGKMAEVFGALSGRHPLFILAVYAPAVAAFSVIAVADGVHGLRRYFSRLLLWRCSPGWYAFLIFGIPLIYFSGSALKGNLSEVSFPYPSFQSVVTALALTMVIGPVEEFGWRGLALPLLQRRLAPFSAGLVLGVVWGIWHLPAFLLSGTPQSGWPFAPFFIGSAAISVIVTPLFNASRGSILLPALFHFQLNNPIWPDAQPHDTVPFVVAAIVVVWVNRRTMFRREDAVTGVIPRVKSRLMPGEPRGVPGTGHGAVGHGMKQDEPASQKNLCGYQNDD